MSGKRHVWFHDPFINLGKVGIFRNVVLKLSHAEQNWLTGSHGFLNTFFRKSVNQNVSRVPPCFLVENVQQEMKKYRKRFMQDWNEFMSTLSQSRAKLVLMNVKSLQALLMDEPAGDCVMKMKLVAAISKQTDLRVLDETPNYQPFGLIRC